MRPIHDRKTLNKIKLYIFDEIWYPMPHHMIQMIWQTKFLGAIKSLN